MAKNPTLSIVSSVATNIEPPRQLGRPGTELWRAIQREYGITDSGGVELLLQACGALDLIEVLNEAIKRDGPVIYGRSGPKANPVIKDQIQARAFLVRTLTRLGVTDEAIKPVGRPATPSGWTGE